MDKISLIIEQELLKHVVEKSHMLSEAEKPMYKVGDNVKAWIQGGAPSKYKISGIAHIKVPIGDLKKGDPIYIAKKGNKTFYLTDADMRDPMNEKTLRPNGDVEEGDVLNDIQEAKRINRKQAGLYEKGLKKAAKSVTFAKAAVQDGNVKLFVNYTKFGDRAKLKRAGEKMGLTYLSDGRVSNRPTAKPIGGGVLGIQNNWMKFAKER